MWAPLRAPDDSSLPGACTEESEGRRRPRCQTAVLEMPSTVPREPGGHGSSQMRPCLWGPEGFVEDGPGHCPRVHSVLTACPRPCRRSPAGSHSRAACTATLPP